MKLIYISPFVGEGFFGPTRQVEAILEVWADLGHEGILVPLPANAQRSSSSPGSNYLRDVLGTLALDRRVKPMNPDVIIIRHYLPLPGYLRLRKIAPVFLDVHNDDLEEYRNTSRIRGWAARCWRTRYLRVATGSFFVTSEAAASASFGALNSRRLVLGNSTSATSLRAIPTCGRPVVTYVCGNALPWQGLDIFEMLAWKMPQYDFVLVAPNSVLESRKSAVPPNYMVVEGDVRHQHDEAVDASTVCLGTLALSRSGRRQAAPLKVRYAVGRGIPLLLPYDDEQLRACEDPMVLIRPELDSDVDGLCAALARFVPQAANARLNAKTISTVELSSVETRRLAWITAALSGDGMGS